jgi:transposase
MVKTKTRYTKEFKTEAVKLYHSGGKSLAQSAKDLGIAASTLNKWVEQAKIDEGNGPAGALKSDEREELIRLRRENKQIKLERDFLKKATAFFAKESS